MTKRLYPPFEQLQLPVEVLPVPAAISGVLAVEAIVSTEPVPTEPTDTTKVTKAIIAQTVEIVSQSAPEQGSLLSPTAGRKAPAEFVAKKEALMAESAARKAAAKPSLKPTERNNGQLVAGRALTNLLKKH